MLKLTRRCPRADGQFGHVTAELQALYGSFQRCLDLRDKYMRLSRQRLEDNPANYDGDYNPSPSTSSSTVEDPSTSTSDPAFTPWTIYPPPPTPHWKERDPFTEATETTEEIAEKEAKRREFHWEQVEIPKLEVTRRKRYEMDGNGVYQVYEEGEFREFTGDLILADKLDSRRCRRSQTPLRSPDDQGVLPRSGRGPRGNQ